MIDRPIQAIVVAYHAPAQLSRCLAGLQREFAVTVIDNSSSAEVAAVARRHRASYVDSGSNIGFAAAVNVALARLVGAEADVLLLNPDAIVSPSSVRELARFLHLPANGRLAAVAPRLRDLGQREQRVAWPLPSPLRMCAEAIGLGRLPAHRSFVIGAVLLLRREAIDDVGYFDERFFLYAEEADWQRRASQRGWVSAICSAVLADHAGAGTSTSTRRREALFHAAQETYIRKWYGPAGWWLYRCAACCGAAARSVTPTRERRVESVHRLLLYLRGPCRYAARVPD